MNNLTQSNANEKTLSKGIRIATGVVICGVISTGLASGYKHSKIEDNPMWDNQISRMEAIANWQEDRGNINSAQSLRDRIDDCVYKHERCPEENEFESITELTLLNDDGSEEEYVAIH